MPRGSEMAQQTLLAAVAAVALCVGAAAVQVAAAGQPDGGACRLARTPLLHSHGSVESSCPASLTLLLALPSTQMPMCCAACVPPLQPLTLRGRQTLRAGCRPTPATSVPGRASSATMISA